MRNALTMCGIERLGDLRGEHERVVEGQPPARQARVERLAGQQLHDEIRRVALDAHVVQHADVRMLEPGNQARLALEALAGSRIAHGLGAEHLERHGAAQAGVGGAIHLPHAAFAQGRDDFVGAESGAGR